MSVDFTDNGDETSDCDVCGETVDNDHYADMQAHDDMHRAEEQRVLEMPRFVVFRESPSAWCVLEKYVAGNGRAYYRLAATGATGADADRVVDALEKA